MNEAHENLCSCDVCPGSDCACGCRREAAEEVAFACSASCTCGIGCNCANGAGGSK